MLLKKIISTNDLSVKNLYYEKLHKVIFYVDKCVNSVDTTKQSRLALELYIL